MNRDNILTGNQCKQVAEQIDRVVKNKEFPGEDELSAFTALMFELHKKRANLPGISMDNFISHIRDPFTEEAIQELNDRIDYAHELVWELEENPSKEYLPNLVPLERNGV